MIFKPSQKDKAYQFIDKHFNNNKKVEIKAFIMPKTLSQNGYIWLVFTHIAYECGSDKNQIYYYYLNKFPTFEEIKTPSGETDLVMTSLSRFNKEQTSVFIDCVVTDARQEGFDIPDSEDFKCKQMYEYYKERGLL